MTLTDMPKSKTTSKASNKDGFNDITNDSKLPPVVHDMAIELRDLRLWHGQNFMLFKDLSIQLQNSIDAHREIYREMEVLKRELIELRDNFSLSVEQIKMLKGEYEIDIRVQEK